MTEVIRSLVRQASQEEQGQYQYYLPLFLSDILKLRWLKNHDHVHERIWQELLSYLTVMYYRLGYYRQIENILLLTQFDPLYVPSPAARDNALSINPLQVSRLTIFPDLSHSAATQVWEPQDAHSILDHLMCPESITSSLGVKGVRMQFYCRGIYMVHDVHARSGHQYPPFSRSIRPVYNSRNRYIAVIQFIDDLLHHYARHNVNPRYLISDLSSGACITGDDDLAN
jgi:hypothetical protein